MKRLLTLFLIIKNDIVFLWKTLIDPNTDKKMRIAIIGMALYVISPIDIISDVFPILGQLDDVAIILFITNRVKSQTNRPKSTKRIIREVTTIK